MIAYVRGIVEDLTTDNVVIEVNGIGINVNISADTASRLPREGEPVKLYTYTSVREDAFQLFGFLRKNELELFKQLISVNGIGPKGGLSILSVLDVDDLRYAILSGDAKRIAKAPGIGPKTAQRIILDLKDKVSIDDTIIDREIAHTAAGKAYALDSPAKSEAVEALVALGYDQAESMRAVSSIENIDELDSGQILKAALKRLF